MSQITYDDIRARLSMLHPKRAERGTRTAAAVAVVLAQASGGLEVLFIRRAEQRGDPWSGQMGLPGGRREASDADLLATARRETHEEIGIELPASHLLGELDDLAPSTPVLPPVLVRPYVFGLPGRPPTRLSDEVAGLVWAPLAALPALERHTTVSVRGSEREVAAFVIGPHVVWGMTHRIVKPFLDLML